MEELRRLITNNLDRYPDFDDFYTQIDLTTNQTVSLDTKLDAARSLLEAIIRTILSKIDISLSPRQLINLRIKDASRKIFNYIGDRSGDFDAELVESLIDSVQKLADARNKRGDLSHGHVAPKQNSSTDFINLAVSYCASSSIYILSHFYTLDLSYLTPVVYDDKSNIEFNDYLDENNGAIGKVAYSKALYDLDHDAYIDEQDQFNN